MSGPPFDSGEGHWSTGVFVFLIVTGSGWVFWQCVIWVLTHLTSGAVK
jgi:hypothetical protein